MIRMEDNRVCLVCAAPTDSAHLGMDICRACASFFKRAKMTGAVYPCRQGTQQCVLSSERKFTCRRCRFEKCLSVGIIYDGPMRVRAKPAVPLLHRIEKEFKSMIKRRRVREEVFMNTFPNKVTIPHPRETIYLMNANACVDFYLIAMEESVAFVENTFPALTKLSSVEKDKFCKDYVTKLHLILSSYLTQKVWGDVDTKMMCSVITCYDMEIPFEYYYPEDKGDRKLFESTARSYTDDMTKMFLPQFKRADITDKEVYALTAILLAEHDLPMSEETQLILDEIRQEMFDNLQNYYRHEMGISNFSTRLGNLMSLNHTIQECQALNKVIMRFYITFFDNYITANMLEQLSLD